MKGNGADGLPPGQFVKISEGTLDFAIAEIYRIRALVDARIPPIAGSSVSQRVEQLCGAFDQLVAALSDLPDSFHTEH